MMRAGRCVTIGFWSLLAVSMTTLGCSNAWGSFALERASQSAFEAFQGCMRQSRNIDICQAEISRYIQRAEALLSSNPSHGEQERLDRMFSFLLEELARNSQIASDEGDRGAAQQANAVLRMLEELRPEYLDSLQGTAETMQNVLGAGDLQVRLERHLPELVGTLQADGRLSSRNMAALNAAMSNFDSLPIRLREELQAVSQELDDWLNRYLTLISEMPLVIEPVALQGRLDAYDLVSAGPFPPPDRSVERQRALEKFRTGIRNEATSAMLVLDETRRLWEEVHSHGELNLSRDFDNAIIQLKEKKQVSQRIQRIVSDAALDMPDLLVGFVPSEEILRLESWTDWIFRIEYLLFIQQNNVQRALLRLEKLVSGEGGTPIDEQLRRLGEKAIAQSLVESVNQALGISTERALDLVMDLEPYVAMSFLESHWINEAFRIIELMAGERDAVACASQIAKAFSVFYGRSDGSRRTQRLKQAVISLVEQSIESQALESKYGVDGFRATLSYVQSIPEVLQSFSQDAASRIQDRQFDGLLRSAIPEVKASGKIYDALTKDLRIDDFDAFFSVQHRNISELVAFIERDCSGDLHTCSRRKNRAKSDAATVRTRYQELMADLQEQLPVGRRQLYSLIPEESFRLCFLENVTRRDVKEATLDRIVEGLERYHVSNIFLPRNTFETSTPVKSGFVFHLVVEEEDFQRYAFDVARDLISQCANDYSKLMVVNDVEWPGSFPDDPCGRAQRRLSELQARCRSDVLACREVGTAQFAVTIACN